MGGGQPKQPTVTQMPTKSPQQMQFLDTLLSFFPEAMTGFNLGERYGGPGQASHSYTIGEGKGGSAPAGGPGGGRRDRRNPRSSPLDSALTGPIVESFRQGQTGNYPRRGGR